METAYLIAINEEGEDTIVAKVALTKPLYCKGELTCFTMVINGKKEIPVVYCGDKQGGEKVRKVVPIKTDTLPELRSSVYIEEIYNFDLLEKTIGDV